MEETQVKINILGVNHQPVVSHIKLHQIHLTINHIGGVMVSVPPASSVADRRFEPQSGEIEDYKIGICCFSASAKNAALN